MLLSNKEGEPDHTWHGGMMSIRFFFKLLIFSGFWASLTVVGFPLTSVAVASSLQASVEMRAIVHFFRGANFQRDNELNEAIDEYKQALKLDDQFAEAYNNLGTVYFEKPPRANLRSAVHMSQSSNSASAKYIES